MAQAARRKSRRSKQRRKADRSSWSMLVIGLVCGTILAALYMGYQENEPGQFGSGIRSLLEKEPRAEPRAEAPAPEPEAPEPEVKLDYHEVLPNIDEVISESELGDEADPTRERPQENHQYILQAGSYKSEQDAESMKAKLALAGFEAVIQRVKINYKGTYFRVRMGPYDSRRKLQVDKKRLAKQGVNALALRLEPPAEQVKQAN